MFKIQKMLTAKNAKIAAVSVIVLLLTIALVKYFFLEHFTGLDSSFLTSVGSFVTGEESINLIEQPESVQSEDCYIPSVLEEQKKFLSQQVDALTSSDLLPSAEDEITANVLFSGFQHGVDSRVSKNANQQLRSDPVVPRVENISPFNQPVIDSQDIYRKTLEIS
jgi:hypothetical protein